MASNVCSLVLGLMSTEHDCCLLMSLTWDTVHHQNTTVFHCLSLVVMETGLMFSIWFRSSWGKNWYLHICFCPHSDTTNVYLLVLVILRTEMMFAPCYWAHGDKTVVYYLILGHLVTELIFAVWYFPSLNWSFLSDCGDRADAYYLVLVFTVPKLMIVVSFYASWGQNWC